MMIDNAISKIYQQDKKVFIPEFGALIYSEFNDDIDFNPHLNFDDGKIILEIQKQESMSEDEAKKSLEEYVEHLRANLEAKGTHLIGGIGYINKGEDGELTIAKSISEPVILDEGAADSEDTEDLKITDENESNDDTAPDPEDEHSDSITETAIEQEIDTKEDAIISEEELLGVNEQKIEDLLEPDVISEEIENQEDEFVEEESIEPDYSYLAEEEEPFQAEEEEDESSKNRKRPILVAVTVILLLAVIAVPVYLFVFKTDSHDNEAISGLARGELQSKIEPGQEKDEVIPEQNDPLLNAEKESNESSGNVTTEPEFDAKMDNQKVYSLILGSFKVENNADNFKRYLGEKGLEVSKFHRNGSFHFVGIEQIKGKPNAVKLLAELRKEEEPTAWIIKKL